jgi:hypothetical protein
MGQYLRHPYVSCSRLRPFEWRGAPTSLDRLMRVRAANFGKKFASFCSD